MADLESVIVASARGVDLSLGEVLHALKSKGRLASLISETLVELLASAAAAREGIHVSDAELQKAADQFRYRHGLTDAGHARNWLRQRSLTLADFEKRLESELLMHKLKDYLARSKVPEHFAARRDHYARARLRVIVVPTEDLALELLAQLKEEGREFAQLARAHSVDPASRHAGGSLGVVLRSNLESEIASAVFAGKVGDIVGPFATAEGAALFLIEEQAPPTLDEVTTAAIRDELFREWRRDQLAGASIRYDWLGPSDAA